MKPAQALSSRLSRSSPTTVTRLTRWSSPSSFQVAAQSTSKTFSSQSRSQLSPFRTWEPRSSPSWAGTSTSRCLSTKANESSDPVFHSGEAPSFAFAFDIDGVLLHVARPIPGARESLKYLQDNNIPFILLTNGGGKHEKDRVSDLSAKLDLELTVDNFVQSHTPFRELVHGPEGLSDKTVMLTGADASKCREIAKEYGFKNVVTPADILRAHPEIWPFEPLMESLYETTARPLPRPLHQGAHMHDHEALKIDAIFVFNDPRDWALDVQIILDLLLSRQGVLGTYSSKNGDRSLPNDGWQQDGQPPLIFSNADLFWSATYHQPRLGQGAFQAALKGLWARVTGDKELQVTSFGKPFPETYRYAERVLNEHRATVLGTGEEGKKSMTPLKRVYMVGDNPESDIHGANDFVSPRGTLWDSILVRTGVWSPERGEPVHKPKVIVDDVKAAVEWALKREGH